MVDFSKRLAKKDVKSLTDPIAIYDTLDRASDKGPLRPAQDAILRDWYATHRDKRDTIIKLHTGQGKTLIGLLILQSKLNESAGPAVYLCPNQFLVNQTCTQAKQFGVAFCTAKGDLPVEFIDGKAILITLVQKLFNGLTKFGLGSKAIEVGAVLIDDAHACIDAIRNSYLIRLGREEQPYVQIRDLFSADLQNQGMGTYADICNQDYDALLPVPYWDWRDKHAEVAAILSKHSDNTAIKFAWPMIRDMLMDCQCVISGGALEIAPYLPPLHLFGSFYKAAHRVFMSATVADDSFLVKGLGLASDTIRNPLVLKKERWSGEKMVLLPSLIDESLDRSAIVNWLGKPMKGRSGGVVALVPSFRLTKDWEACGATIAKKETIDVDIDKLRTGNCDSALVIANRYDGIDLPDSSCRILIFDSKPYSESLIDLYAEECRGSSEVTAIRTARTIEQGLGRSVRGEKDYCAIILIGPELIKAVRSRSSQRHLSNQTRAQIRIGLEVAEMVREELKGSTSPFDALVKLIRQCLKRDPGWKAFYVEQMDAVAPEVAAGSILEIFEKELDAESRFSRGDVEGAVEAIQGLLDKHVMDKSDKGWYLQEMARYLYAVNKTDSNKMQKNAHLKNHALMKPRTGMTIAKIAVISHKRMENIIDWVKDSGSFEELMLAVGDILSRLTFGVKADRFEAALNELAFALGFVGQRPEKEWKEGPDNLWGLRDGEFMLFECKSEVLLDRAEINKHETEQMNRSCAWFEKNYKCTKVKNVIIIPPRKLDRAAALTHNVEVLQNSGLQKLVLNVRTFFAAFNGMDFKDLSEARVQDLIDTGGLSVDSLFADYTKPNRP